MSLRNNYLFGYEVRLPCSKCNYGYRITRTVVAFKPGSVDCRVYCGWRDPGLNEVVVASIGDVNESNARQLRDALTAEGVIVRLALGKTHGRYLRYAESVGIDTVIFVDPAFIVKRLSTRTERRTTTFSELLELLRK